MTRERFELLLDELLERELTAAEAEELAAAVRGEAGLRGELRRHLVLWELWAQEQTPERSAEAFLAACRTRLRAEREDESFVADLKRRIGEEGDGGDTNRGEVDRGGGAPHSAAGGASARSGDPAPQPRDGRTEATAAHGLFRWWRALQQPTGALWTAVSVVAVACAVWMLSPRAARATTTTLHGEAVCTACMLHETHEHLPAIRVRDAETTKIYYVQSARDAFFRIGDYCRAPVPLIATGHAEVQAGRLLFNAESLQSTTAHDPNKRILFPF